MVEIVAERGYAATTVRALAGLAAVSTRTFYQHYSSKEDCLLRTHELIVRRLLKRLVSATASRDAGDDRIKSLVKALVGEWSCDPGAARLMLVDVCAAGPSAALQARKAICTIEVVVSESLYCAGDWAEAPAWLAEGIVAGLIGVVRSRLLAGEGGQLADLGDCLAQWAISCCSPLATQLEESAHRPPLEIQASEELPFYPVQPSGLDGEEGTIAATGDRALLLSAVAKLAAVEGAECVTSKKVLATAGLPRRSFSANFGSVEDCLVAARERRAVEAIATAKRAAGKGLTIGESVYLAMSTLCAQIAEDIVFAHLCFGGIATAGPRDVHCHERLTADLVGLVQSRGLEGDDDKSAIEASASAFWIILENEIGMGRSSQVIRSAKLFTYLLLAPTVGPLVAVEAVQAKLSNQTRED